MEVVVPKEVYESIVDLDGEKITLHCCYLLEMFLHNEGGREQHLWVQAIYAEDEDVFSLRVDHLSQLASYVKQPPLVGLFEYGHSSSVFCGITGDSLTLGLDPDSDLYAKLAGDRIIFRQKRSDWLRIFAIVPCLPILQSIRLLIEAGRAGQAPEPVIYYLLAFAAFTGVWAALAFRRFHSKAKERGEALCEALARFGREKLKEAETISVGLFERMKEADLKFQQSSTAD